MEKKRVSIRALLPGLAALAFPLLAQVPAGSPRVVDFPDTPSARETPVARTISADLLRQPLSAKARQILQRAQQAADAGDHTSAIGLLEAALEKYPESTAWTQSLRGGEYIRTDRFADAVTSLEQAVLLLPRDMVDRSNLGLALACTGQYDRAERELRRALALDGSSLKTRQLLEVVVNAELAATLASRLARNPN